jgi:CDGSH-type Zn-finger protein
MLNDVNGKIKIVENGPYLVTGSVPLSEKIIVPNGIVNEYRQGCEFPLREEYALCRCGATHTPPYCDGTHVKIRFQSRETASRKDYEDRAQVLEGPNLTLRDDNRCAYARFCHRKDGSVWELTENSDDPYLREEAIIAASECPAGRLVAYTTDQTPIEPEYEPSIELLQDPANGVSGPLFVKGNIQIEASDGFQYEKRNREALCRCGKTRNSPFCDATHVSAGYKDK